MERDSEELQFLGVVGIVSEAFQILASFVKLLGAVTLTLVLPLSFAILGHHFVSDYLQSKIPWFTFFYLVIRGGSMSERGIRHLTWDSMELFSFLAAYEVFVLAFSLLSTAAVVYTVASIYTRKGISYTRVMSVVPRVWKRLMGTFLWFFLMDFACYTASVSVFLLLLYAVIVHKVNWGTFHSFRIFTLSVYVCVHVYISMVWHLACVISVLEEKYGLGAMRKSKNLIKGNRSTALVLDILYLVLVAVIGWFFGYAVLHGHHHGVGSAGRGAYGTVFVGLLCFVHLMGLLTQTVFYFVCKSYHHEIIEKSSLSNHLEAYLGDYLPLNSSNIELGDLPASV